MRIRLAKLFITGIASIALTVSLANNIGFAEEGAFTIATGSDPVGVMDHTPSFFDSVPFLWPTGPGIQQHGSINIEGNGAFGGSIGIGIEEPETALHVVGTTSSFIGNVGIGTTTPATELHVIGTITAAMFVGDGSGLSGVGAGDGHSLDALGGSPEDVVYVDGAGNVGIGTITPEQKLSVAGIIESTSGGIKFPDGTTQTSASSADGYSLDAQDGSPTDVVSVDDDGNVGIGLGTMTTSVALEVVANDATGGHIQFDGNNIYFDNDTQFRAHEIGSPSGNNDVIYLVTDGVARFKVEHTTGNIHMPGKVGIGISPQRSLHVDDIMRLEPQASAPTGGKGDLYAGTDGKLYFHNGSAWKEVSLVP